MEDTIQNRINKQVFHYQTTKIALLFFFISDGLNKLIYLITENDTPLFSPSLFSRMVFEILALIVILSNLNKQRFYFIVAALLLSICYVTGLVFYLMEYDFPFQYFYHLSLFNKYFFTFIVYYFIYKLSESPTHIEKLQSFCESLFVLNSIFVIVGAAFSVQLFRSYVFMDYRFGYNGILPSVNESSLFYFIALSYLYYKVFVLNRKLGVSIVILIAALLLGTKAVYGFILLLVVFHFFRVSTLKAKFYAFMGTIFIAFLTVLVYRTGIADDIIEYYYFLYKQKGTLFSTLVTGRDIYFETKFYENIEHWTFLNYFFGGQDQLRFLIEMDLFDVFLFFGIIGTMLYFTLFFRSVFNLNYRKKFNILFVLSYFGLAGLGGHFFASAVNSLYLVIFCLFIQYIDKAKGPTTNTQ